MIEQEMFNPKRRKKVEEKHLKEASTKTNGLKATFVKYKIRQLKITWLTTNLNKVMENSTLKGGPDSYPVETG